MGDGTESAFGLTLNKKVTKFLIVPHFSPTTKPSSSGNVALESLAVLLNLLPPFMSMLLIPVCSPTLRTTSVSAERTTMTLAFKKIMWGEGREKDIAVLFQYLHLCRLQATPTTRRTARRLDCNSHRCRLSESKEELNISLLQAGLGLL